MSEYIGARISLISKRDIRYVGTLHEISSENSTVALEQVVSYGTEDRNANPSEFVPPADNVYEYIVFRGSDVKDLRIESEPEKRPPQPQVPDDPAILGNARPIGRPPVSTTQTDQSGPRPPSQDQTTQQPQQVGNNQDQPGGPPRFPQQPQYPFNYPNPRFGPQGSQGPHGFPPYGHPGMGFGPPPPGWYPPPGHGFPPGPPNQFYQPPHMPQGPPGQQPGFQRPPSKPVTPAEVMAGQPTPPQPSDPEKQSATVKLPSSSTTPAPAPVAQNGPPPPTESKPDVAAALAPPATAASNNATTNKSGSILSKSGRIMPAVPIVSQKPKAPVNGDSQPVVDANAIKQTGVTPGQIPIKSYEDANRDARAAVAAAMAKLPPQGQQKKQVNGDTKAIDNLTKKVNEMRTDESIRSSRQPGTGGYAAGNRGGRGGYRGGRPRTESQTKKIDVPKTDYDFASANAKFNKQDLVKEAIAGGSPATANTPDGATGESSPAETGSRRASTDPSVVIPPAPSYNKTSSFFDNISSESKDREDPASKKLGGREFRSEEQKKNLETFGQGSVDGGHRGGYRGRGRGRGYRGGRGRGGFRGRGAVAAEG